MAKLEGSPSPRFGITGKPFYGFASLRRGVVGRDEGHCGGQEGSGAASILRQAVSLAEADDSNDGK